MPETVVSSEPKKSSSLDVTVPDEVVSPEVKQLRKELRIATNVFTAFSEATIKAAMAETAVETLEYLNQWVKIAQLALDARLEDEAKAAKPALAAVP